MGQGIKWISTTWFKLWTGLLALKIQLELKKTRHSRQLCLLWKQKDNALLLQTWHGTPWWCEHWAWVMLCVRGWLGSKLWDSRLFVMPASSSQSHVPAPATSTIIHAHYFILHDQISYLRLPPNWSPRLVCLLGSVIKWRESECNDNCVQDPQHCSYAASKIQFPLGTIQVFHHHKSTTHWSKIENVKWI